MENSNNASQQAGNRYDAMLGFNTKQFWLYDNVNDSYIDPPTEVLEEIDAIRYPNGGAETAESFSAAQRRLEQIANEENPEWLHDGYEYFGGMEI